ncbi:MAG: ribonucleoside-diphosphate reductase beta chain [Candidatus Eremiobacteraeota bacterium]|jgi:ribonucleoside-diphosphate reductase beta chain|nr:ribonucleoside-diphosphate reductase beta chain [Candidatus Eremiobacteraeota bacterium]
MAHEHTARSIETAPDADLGARTDSLDEAAHQLWRKAVRFGTWDPAAIDLSADKAQFAELDRPLQVYLTRFCAAFFNAEENVAKLFAPWVMAAPSTQQQAFLSTQLIEEFKHADFFERYFGEVVGELDRGAALPNPVHDSLDERAQRLTEALRWPDDERTMCFVESVVHYQGVIEGVQANTGYHIFLDVFARKGLMPGLTEGFRNIQIDEGRHVGFGMRILRHYAQADERYARRIRDMYEEFLPLIRKRYGQRYPVDGKLVDPPAEERGVERLMALYERRQKDIFAS